MVHVNMTPFCKLSAEHHHTLMGQTKHFLDDVVTFGWSLTIVPVSYSRLGRPPSSSTPPQLMVAFCVHHLPDGGLSFYEGFCGAGTSVCWAVGNLFIFHSQKAPPLFLSKTIVCLLKVYHPFKEINQIQCKENRH